MDWLIKKNRAVQSLHGSMSVIIKVKKTLLYKNIICLFCISLFEWAALCHVLHTQVCSLAPLVVFNSACCLTIWGQTLRASLTQREQLIILSSFYLRKPLSNTRKALHYYFFFFCDCGSLDTSNAYYCPPQFTNTCQNKSRFSEILSRNWQKLQLYYNVVYF